MLGKECLKKRLPSVHCFRESIAILISWVSSFHLGILSTPLSFFLSTGQGSPCKAILKSLFLSGCLNFGNNPPSVDAWEPICEKGCSSLVISQPELGLQNCKQICCQVRGKFIIDTEKSVVLGWAPGQKEGVDSARKSQHFMSTPSKDLPLSTSRNNFPPASGEEKYSM